MHAHAAHGEPTSAVPQHAMACQPAHLSIQRRQLAAQPLHTLLCMAAGQRQEQRAVATRNTAQPSCIKSDRSVAGSRYMEQQQDGLQVQWRTQLPGQQQVVPHLGSTSARPSRAACVQHSTTTRRQTTPPVSEPRSRCRSNRPSSNWRIRAAVAAAASSTRLPAATTPPPLPMRWWLGSVAARCSASVLLTRPGPPPGPPASRAAAAAAACRALLLRLLPSLLTVRVRRASVLLLLRCTLRRAAHRGEGRGHRGWCGHVTARRSRWVQQRIEGMGIRQ